MFSKMGLYKSLQARVLFQILLIVILMFVFIGVFVGVSSRMVATKQAHEFTQLQSELNAARVKSDFEKHFSYIEMLSASVSTTLNDSTQSVQQFMSKLLSNQSINHPEYLSVWTIWKENRLPELGKGQNGWLLLESLKNSNSVNVVNDIHLFNLRFDEILNSKSNNFSAPYSLNDELCIDLSSPIIESGSVIGYSGVTIALSYLSDFIQTYGNQDGLFLTVLANNSTFIAHSNSNYLGRTFAENFPIEAQEFNVDTKVSAGEAFNISTEFNNDVYYSCFEPIFVSNCTKSLSVEVTYSMNSLLVAAKKSVLRSIIAAFLAMLLMVIVIWRVSQSIVKPIKKVTKVLQFLSLGNTASIDKVEMRTKDELNEMGEFLNRVIAGNQLTENFVLEIGKGNLEVEFEPLSDDDQLGDALLQMREGIQVSKIEESKRIEEENIRNWSNEGVAKFSEILRNNNDDLNRLGSEFLRNLVDYLNINQAALFVLNNETDEQNPFFELVNAVAYGREKLLKKEIQIGEGLIGRCAFEKKSIYITNVPDSYHDITSGLGTANPKCVLIVPCVLNNEVYSVIELAAFTPLKQHEIEFIELLSESIASTISSVRVNEKTNRLLNNSQKQSEELAAQEEELRQNLEEMEATQEDLQRQMKENIQMRESLKEQNVLLDALLISLPDLIYFKDKQSKFLRVSKSMLGVFDAESEGELIGKSDFDFQTKENAQIYFDDEKQIMDSKQGFVNKLQKEQKIDGSEMWNSVTKMPLVDEDGNVFGTFGISKDVSEIKELELEAQIQKEEANSQRALLDALLKSIPDFIYFKDKDSKFLRISDSMLSLFNAKSVNEVMGKSDFDFQEKEAAQEYYDDEQEIIKSKKGITDKIQKEVHLDGTVHWASVTKLPLIDVKGKAIGTFGISKDVTELKKYQLDTKIKNEELQAQEEELRQNLEEMQTVQEDLRTQMDINRVSRENLTKEKILLDSLMNKLPDYIYFKDKESKFIRISQSMTGLFGAKNAKEIIGKSDFDFQTPENAQKYYDDEQKIIKSKKGIFDKLQKETTGTGEIIWNLVTKLPLMDDEGNAVGTFGVSKNVTKVLKDKK